MSKVGPQKTAPFKTSRIGRHQDRRAWLPHACGRLPTTFSFVSLRKLERKPVNQIISVPNSEILGLKTVQIIKDLMGNFRGVLAGGRYFSVRRALIAAVAAEA